MAHSSPVRWLSGVASCAAGPSSGLLRQAQKSVGGSTRTLGVPGCRACSSALATASVQGRSLKRTQVARQQYLATSAVDTAKATATNALQRSDGVAEDSVIDALESRGILHQLTSQRSLRKHLSSGTQRAVYVGIDPSADSLHVGNLLPLVAILHFLDHGHRVVIVVGGATGSIGDPSGRSTERQAISRETVMRNVQSIKRQIEAVMSHGVGIIAQRKATAGQAPQESAFWPDATVSSPVAGYPDLVKEISDRITIVNNLDWYEGMNVLTFLRNVGKLARVGTMLARDSVKSRMSSEGAGARRAVEDGQPGVGLSFTEFSYQLLQAYDFSILHQPPHNCSVQIGGSDQMGNIAAGVDLIRRIKLLANGSEPKPTKTDDAQEDPAYGLTLPLLTTASGAKLGKSAGNAVWLDENKSGNHDFFQYFYRFRDDEVERYLKALTLLPVAEIAAHMARHAQDPAARHAQHILATEVMKLVRTEADYKSAVRIRDMLYGDAANLTREQVEDVFAREPSSDLLQRRSAANVIDHSLAALLVDIGLVLSKSEARRAIREGGIRINGVAVQDHTHVIRDNDVLPTNGLMIIAQGQRRHRVVLVQKHERDTSV